MSISEARSVGAPPTVRLSASVDGNPFAEVVLVDPDFQMVAAAMGHLDAEVPPGVYRVDFKAGRAVRREYVMITGDMRKPIKVSLRADQLPLPAVVPLAYGRPAAPGEAEDAVVEHAVAWSSVPTVELGAGSCLFVFGHGGGLREGGNPVGTLKLRDVEGRELLAFATGPRCDAALGLGGGCIKLNSGTYVLRFERAGAEPVEQSVVCLAGWATQVFYRWRDREPPAEDSGQPDATPVVAAEALPECAMLMSRIGRPFDPRDADVYRVESLHVALASGRRTSPPLETIEECLAGEVNPMVALLAGHLLSRLHDPPRDLIARICGVLESHGPLADVLALRAWAGDDSRAWSGQERAAAGTPPLLRSSYEYLADASLRDPSLIPPGARLSRVSEHVWGSGTWFRWQAPDPAPVTRRTRLLDRIEAISASPLAGIVIELFGGRPALRRVLAARAGWDDLVELLRAFAWTAWRWLRNSDLEETAARLHLSPSERALLQYLLVVVAPYVDPVEHARIETADGLLRGDVRPPRLTYTLAPKQIAAALRLPSGTIMRAIRGLVEKLGPEMVRLPVEEASTPEQLLDDTQKGRFGGKPTRNGRRLDASVEAMPGDPDWFDVEVRVGAEPGAPPLEGEARFHLHETFGVPEGVPVRIGHDGRAVWRGRAWGAFTVGVECDTGGTRLEIDLAELPDAPPVFRSR